MNSTQLGSATVSDSYYRDNSDFKFVLGGLYDAGVLTGSWQGNIYELKIYNYKRSMDASDLLTSET